MRAGGPTGFANLPPLADTLVGRLVRAFSALEYWVGVAVLELSVTGEADDPKSPAARELEKALTSPTSEKIKGLRLRFESADANPDWKWALDEQMDLFRYRNLICHGIWIEHEDGSLSVSFRSNQGIRLMRTIPESKIVLPDHERMSPAGWESLVDRVLDHATLFEDLVLRIRQASESDQQS